MADDDANNASGPTDIDDFLDTSSEEEDSSDEDVDSDADASSDEDDDEEFVEVSRPSKPKPPTKPAATSNEVPAKAPPKKHLPKKHAPTKAPPKKHAPRSIGPQPSEKPTVPTSKDGPELYKRWDQLQTEFLIYSNWRLLPGQSCHRSDVVKSFRQHFPKYAEEEALETSEIELLLQDWYHRKIRLTIDDGTYEGFHLNPKLIDKIGGSPNEVTTPPVKPSASNEKVKEEEGTEGGEKESEGEKSESEEKSASSEEEKKKKKKDKKKSKDKDEKKKEKKEKKAKKSSKDKSEKKKEKKEKKEKKKKRRNPSHKICYSSRTTRSLGVNMLSPTA